MGTITDLLNKHLPDSQFKKGMRAAAEFLAVKDVMPPWGREVKDERVKWFGLMEDLARQFVGAVNGQRDFEHAFITGYGKEISKQVSADIFQCIREGLECYFYLDIGNKEGIQLWFDTIMALMVRYIIGLGVFDGMYLFRSVVGYPIRSNEYPPCLDQIRDRFREDVRENRFRAGPWPWGKR